MKKQTTNAASSPSFEIIFFELSDTDCPVQEFLDSLDDKMAAKMYGMMSVLEEKGNALRRPYSAPLGDGIFELRAIVGSDISRALYFFYAGKKIIMTNGFIKKTQKTPRSVIALAKKYRKEYYKQQEEQS